jgi:TM2 domain-containing membrane protein YozV
MLQQQTRQQEAAPAVRRKSSPVIAALLSLICPGLGAAYNGQTSKAIVHFAIFASFFQMAIVTEGMAFFIFGFIGTWLYAAVDACRTAQLMRSGFAPGTVEDAIARRLYGNPLAWSLTLIVLGTLFLLHTLLGIRLPVRQFLPVALVALGGYMLYDYISRRLRGERKPVPVFDTRLPPPSVVSAPLDAPPPFRTGELITQVSARDLGR